MSDKFHLAANIEQPFVIGRSANCDLILKDSSVSRQHAQIYRENSLWIYEDLNSSTGSWLGKQKIAKQVINNSLLIRVGLSDLHIQNLGQDLLINRINRANSFLNIPWQEGTTLRIGRAANADIYIKHPLCPLHYAEIFFLATKVHISFLKQKFYQKTTEKIIENQELLNIGWGSIYLQDQVLQWIEAPVGFNVKVSNLQVKLQDKYLLKNFNLHLHSGELLYVIGASGQGKSSFLNAVNGKWKSAYSQISINGVSPHQNQIKQGVAFLKQHTPLRNYLTVYETLDHQAQLRLPKDFDQSRRREIIDDYLKLMGLEHLRNSLIRTLSGGEKKRVALVNELLSQPGLLLLDEPFSGLDSINSANLAHWLRQISWQGYSMIITTHDLSTYTLADRVLIVHEGYMAFYGNPSQALSFFNARNGAHILQKITEKSGKEWNQAFKDSRPGYDKFTPQEKTYAPQQKQESKNLNYLKLTLNRFLKSIYRDKGRLWTLIAQPLIISLLFFLLFNKNSSTWVAAFALNMSSIWFALSLGIREITAERERLLVELQGGAPLNALIFGKSLAVLLVTLLQSSICAFALQTILQIKLPWASMILALSSGLLATLTLGLAISAMVKNSNQANATLPLILIPQLMFAGAIVPLDQMHPLGRSVAYITGSQYFQKALQNIFTATAISTELILAPLIISLCFIIIAMLNLKYNKE